MINKAILVTKQLTDTEWVALKVAAIEQDVTLQRLVSTILRQWLHVTSDQTCDSVNEKPGVEWRQERRG